MVDAKERITIVVIPKGAIVMKVVAVVMGKRQQLWWWLW